MNSGMNEQKAILRYKLIINILREAYLFKKNYSKYTFPIKSAPEKYTFPKN